MGAPHELDQLIQQARERVQRRSLSEAVALYTQVLATNDREPRALEGLAVCAFMAGDYTAAEGYYRRLILVDPRRSDALINLGAVYNRKHDYPTAVRTLQQALSKNRKSPEAYYNLGIAYKGMNQPAMAISAYKEAVRLSPLMAEAYQNLGNLYVDMGYYQQAILNFNRALEIRPDFEKAHRGLAIARQQVEKHANPFGRLVPVEDATQASAAQSPAPELRSLTVEEQIDDRLQILRIATDFERHAHNMLAQLRERISPALLGLSHTFAQSETSQRQAIFEDFHAAFSSYRSAAATVLHAGDRLQEHEEAIHKALRSGP